MAKTIVLVGSKNKSKVDAVKSAFGKFFKNVEVKGIDVATGVGKQPLSLEETVQGAINRAKQAWKKEKCDFGVGIESGIFHVPKTKTGYMDAAAIAIFDGKKIHLGLTPAFEYPRTVLKKIFKEKKEVTEAFEELWGEKIRDEAGAIGRLSKGKVPRRLFNEIGLVMALAPIVNKKYYK